MGSPHTFLHRFRQELHTAGVRFAITSGQACVYFGIQQTTKDSDWVVEPDDLGLLRAMLHDAELAGQIHVSYRGVCGAPLEQEFLAGGWTSHLAIRDADSDEHLLDFFGKAPRVDKLEHDGIEPDYASRQVVAQMKKTDREKDWPFVFALGRQAVASGDMRGVLHGQDADWLIANWNKVPANGQGDLIRQRPLLGFIDSQPNRLRRAIVIERQLWISVNRERYGIYQRLWKDFYRQWRQEPKFEWPAEIPFLQQHEKLLSAAQRYELQPTPLDETARRGALVKARADAAEIFAADDGELDLIAPPLEVLLP